MFSFLRRLLIGHGGNDSDSTEPDQEFTAELSIEVTEITISAEEENE
jgi:hypothetical protein